MLRYVFSPLAVILNANIPEKDMCSLSTYNCFTQNLHPDKHPLVRSIQLESFLQHWLLAVFIKYLREPFR